MTTVRLNNNWCYTHYNPRLPAVWAALKGLRMSSLVNDMLAAMRRAEAIGKPVTEQRLHPDDYDALRRAAGQHMWQPAPPSALPDLGYMRFNGIKIVVDEDAPRLPRRAQSTPQPPAPPADHP